MQRSDGPTPPLDPTRVLDGEVLIIAGAGTLTSRSVTAPIVVGRDATCDVVISNAALSRRHVIVRPGPPVTVQDLESTNGTRIGDRLVHGGEPLELHAGDSFHIGPFSFLLVSRAAGSDRSATGQELLRVEDPTISGATALLRELAVSDVSVLVLGETGVGKEVLAETMHALSTRRGRLVRINCAALTEPLLESELFGHEKGAFTGATGARPGLLEAAHGGSLFLDELGELPAGIQAKLLRAVEQREVVRIGSTQPIPIDVRFIAATNRDLPSEVKARRFRRDLFFRLDGVTLSIPPLRERVGAIGPLALMFLANAYARAGKPMQPIATDVLARLESYEWPGNVRELKAVVERAVLLARGASPAARHVVFAQPTDIAEGAPAEPLQIELGAGEREDRGRVVAALDKCSGNQTRAAKLLGISRSTLINKVRYYRIPRPRS